MSVLGPNTWMAPPWWDVEMPLCTFLPYSKPKLPLEIRLFQFLRFPISPSCHVCRFSPYCLILWPHCDLLPVTPFSPLLQRCRRDKIRTARLSPLSFCSHRLPCFFRHLHVLCLPTSLRVSPLYFALKGKKDKCFESPHLHGFPPLSALAFP